MRSWWWAVFVALLPLGIAQLDSDPVKLRNWCIDSKNHKQEPGPEDELHQQCTPWKERACCTRNTSVSAHEGKLYNFNWNHCHLTSNMSAKCQNHFVQDLCFYECDPNLGPWVVKVNMAVRKERFHKVPLCASDCDEWFSACKDDYTCTPNWITGFVWKNGVNTCREPDSCRTFKEVYGNASSFCEQVWDDSWRYANDKEPCMRLWFDGKAGNPNINVADIRIAELQVQWANAAVHYHILRPLLFSVVILFVYK